MGWLSTLCVGEYYTFRMQLYFYAINFILSKFHFAISVAQARPRMPCISLVVTFHSGQHGNMLSLWLASLSEPHICSCSVEAPRTAPKLFQVGYSICVESLAWVKLEPTCMQWCRLFLQNRYSYSIHFLSMVLQKKVVPAGSDVARTAKAASPIRALLRQCHLLVLAAFS